jgi:hypothetical protein
MRVTRKFNFYRILVIGQEVQNSPKTDFLCDILYSDGIKHEIDPEDFGIQTSNTFNYKCITFNNQFLLSKLGKERIDTYVSDFETDQRDEVIKHDISYLVVDLRERDGDEYKRTLAIESSMDSKDAINCLEAWLNAEAIKRKSTYRLRINGINKKDDFWHFMDTYKGNVASFEVTYTAPNLFEEVDETLYKNLDHLLKTKNATSYSYKINNPEGTLRLEREDTEINSQLRFVELGAATLSAKNKNNIEVYSSKERPQSKKFSYDTTKLNNAKPEDIDRLLLELTRGEFDED